MFRRRSAVRASSIHRGECLLTTFRRAGDLYAMALECPTYIRSSKQLEVAASELSVTDSSLIGSLCWSRDLTFDHAADKWTTRAFRKKTA